jgi:hypothetical protein
MNRIRNIAAVVLGAALAAGAAGTASAQSNDPQQKPSDSTQHPSDKAAGGATGTTKEQAQEKLDREKVTLKDKVQDGISLADTNVDALKKIQDSEKGAPKEHAKDMEKKLTDLKDNLKKDLDKIEKATPSDWSSVHASVTKDLSSMDQELKVATTITHVPLPTGAANKQPEGKTNKQPAPKPAPEKTNP